MISDWARNYIEKNINTIENEDFDTLFTNCPRYLLRLDLAEALLSAGIDFVNQEEQPRDNIYRFLSDLRISRNVVKIVRGSRTHDYTKVNTKQTRLYIPDFRLMIEIENTNDYHHLFLEYSIDKMVEEPQYNPRDPGRQRMIPVLIFN